MKTKEEIETKYNEIKEKFREMNSRDALDHDDMENYYGLDYGVYILKWVLDLQ